MSTNGKLEIREDITDWRDQAMRDEMLFSTEEDVFDALRKGARSQDVARAVIVSQEIGELQERITRPNRMLIQSAASADVAKKFSEVEVEIFETKRGRYEVPAYIGSGIREELTEDEKEDGIKYEPSYVSILSEDGKYRTQNYMDNVVVGHIWNRLAAMKLAKVDYHAAAENLIAVIRDKVQELDEA